MTCAVDALTFVSYATFMRRRNYWAVKANGLLAVRNAVLRKALRANGGNRAKTAKDLGVSERTLYRWLRALR